MKTRTTILLLAGVLLAAGCTNQPKEFTTRTVKGERMWQLAVDDSTTEWVHNSYEIEWPAKGVLSGDAERELLEKVFGSYVGRDLRRSCENYLNSQGIVAEEGLHFPGFQVDAIPDTVWRTEQELKVVCDYDERLATVTVTPYIFPAGAAHGSYDIMPVVVDRRSGRIVHLADIVDTNQLGPLVARAVNKLPANSQVKECLFDEFVGKETLPVSQVFSISDGMDTLYMVYGLYWLTPYCCGIQEVALPVSMLHETMALTKQGEELLTTE